MDLVVVFGIVGVFVVVVVDMVEVIDEEVCFGC